MKITATLPIPPSSRSSSGIVDPSDIAAAIGFMPHGPWLFAYMFRRFGPPNIGSDDYKNLASWCISTPLKGCYLTVTPYMADSPDRDYQHTLSFGYCFESALEKRATTASPAIRMELKKWREKVLSWALKRGISIVTDEELDKRKPLNSIPYGDNLKKFHLVWSNLADKRRPVELNRKQILKLDTYGFILSDISAAYRKTHPRAKRPGHQHHNPAVIDRINRALAKTLTEIQRPVFIRDIAITPNGRSDDHAKASASFYEHAGYPCKPCLPAGKQVPDTVHEEIIRRFLKPGDTLTHTRCMGITEEHIYTGTDGPWLCGKPTRDTKRISPCATYSVNDIAPSSVTHINRVPIKQIPEFEEFQKQTRRRHKKLWTIDKWADWKKSHTRHRDDPDDDIPF